MPKRVKKNKVQKQKQKQSQQVIVKIDQSRKTVQRKGKEQSQQQRPNITPIINLPSYPQQQQAPINTSTPTPTSTPTRVPTPVRAEEPLRAEETVRAEVEPIREFWRMTPSIPSAFTGASNRIGILTEPTAPSQFEHEKDNSLEAYMRRQIQPGEAEAAQPLQQEEEELPPNPTSWIGKIRRALMNEDISDEDLRKLQDFNARYANKTKTSYSTREKNLINRYLK